MSQSLGDWLHNSFAAGTQILRAVVRGDSLSVINFIPRRSRRVTAGSAAIVFQWTWS